MSLLLVVSGGLSGVVMLHCWWGWFDGKVVFLVEFWSWDGPAVACAFGVGEIVLSVGAGVFILRGPQMHTDQYYLKCLRIVWVQWRVIINPTVFTFPGRYICFCTTLQPTHWMIYSLYTWVSRLYTQLLYNWFFLVGVVNIVLLVLWVVLCVAGVVLLAVLVGVMRWCCC